MIPFCYTLANEFHYRLQLFRWSSDATLDKLQFWGDQGLQLFQCGFILDDTSYSMARVGMPADEVGLALDRLEYDREMGTESRSRYKQSFRQETDRRKLIGECD